METAGGLGLADIASKVNFSTEQVARMCAVSRRQLAYWSQKGIIGADEGYSLATVERVILIRREIARGLTLRRAVERASRRLDERVRFERTVAGMPAAEADTLCAATLERVESLLLTLREAATGLPLDEQGDLSDAVAALGLQEVLRGDGASLTPREIVICLSRAVGHLELMVDDVRERV